MSYSIIISILLLTISFSLSSSKSFSRNEENVLARFYPNFVQLYRPATLKSYVNNEERLERYEFNFTAKEYSRISKSSLTMLYTNVIERTIINHQMPNFEKKGSKYFYRRNSKENSPIEIELVNPENDLFREVENPSRYFHLSSYDNIEYSDQIPMMPYIEVIFICNSSSSSSSSQSPLLSYIDRSFRYQSRYLLDLSLINSKEQAEISAYADIRNNGEETIVVKGAELIVGDVILNARSFGSNVRSLFSSITTGRSLTRPFDEQTSATHVYPLSLPSSLTIPPHSLKSVQFLTTDVTVKSFVCYSSIFSSVNSNGYLLNAYNITSKKNFLPSGRLLLREEGRFVGQIDLPDLLMNETYTMTFDYDADVSYRRQVKIVESDEYNDPMGYQVQYIFQNSQSSRDVRVEFTESFRSFKHFQIQNISTSNDNDNLPDLVSYGTDLRGSMIIPRRGGTKIMSYNVIIYKYKPTVHFRKQ